MQPPVLSLGSDSRFLLFSCYMEDYFNAFKCNLKELTTKSVFSTSDPRSVGMCIPGISLNPATKFLY